MSWRRHRREARVRGAGHRPLTRLLGSALLAALPALLGVAGAAASAAPAGAAAGQSYVSLGDSYTSGPFIPNQLPNPLGCLRSDHNYPHLAAGALALALTDVSCSGATADMSSPQTTAAGTNPPQLSAVTSTTSVVTVGIGGNDIGFVNVIENCVALTPFGPTRVGQTCQSFYDPGGTPQNDKILAAINATAPKVAAVLQHIHAQAAPGAKVFVVGYPAILPPFGNGCWPQMPLTFSDVPYLRQKEIQLNQMLATQAAHQGAIYVNTYRPSRNFNACQLPGARWIEPVVPLSPAAPVHPNAMGEAGMAGVVEISMAAHGI